MMQITRTIGIVTSGVLTVTVTPTPSSGYVGVPFSIRVRAVGWVGPAPLHIAIAYGDGTFEVYDVIGDNWTFSHNYTSTGSKTITANCTDLQTGATGSGSASVTIATLLAVTFTADKISGAIPLVVTFTFGMSGGYTPYTWALDPGDGSMPYSGPTSPKSHTYNNVGSFTAKLTVTDALGVTLTAETEIVADGEELADLGFLWALAPALAGLALTILR